MKTNLQILHGKARRTTLVWLLCTVVVCAIAVLLAGGLRTGVQAKANSPDGVGKGLPAHVAFKDTGVSCDYFAFDFPRAETSEVINFRAKIVDDVPIFYFLQTTKVWFNEGTGSFSDVSRVSSTIDVACISPVGTTLSFRAKLSFIETSEVDGRSYKNLAIIPVADHVALDYKGEYTFIVYCNFSGLDATLLTPAVPAFYTCSQPYVYTKTTGQPIGPTVPLPDDPSKEGHTFAGWYYGNGENCSEDCAPYIGDTITENTDLHAHWTINMYTVTYNTANGSVVAPATVAWNTAAPMPEPKRTGYNFLGWFREDGTQYNGEVITEDTTLTARWDVQMLTVTFYLDNEIYATVNVEYGTTLAKVMKYAKVIDYLPLDSNGVRVSLRSAITADTTVLLHELSGWEKYGNFVGRSPWYTWLMVGLGSALTLAFAVTLALLIRARR